MSAVFPPVPLTPPRAVLFDLDGTLVDSLGDLVLATNGMLDELALPCASSEQVRSWIGEGLGPLVERALGFAATTHRVPGLDAALEVFARHYAHANGRTTTALAGAEALLDAWALHATPLALVTNKSRRFVLQLLDTLGWRHRFAAIICGDDPGIGKKPAPDPLLAALAQLGAAPHQALMIGDSSFDVLAARAAEVPVIRLREGYGPAGPAAACATWEGATLADIERWVRALGSEA